MWHTLGRAQPLPTANAIAPRYSHPEVHSPPVRQHRNQPHGPDSPQRGGPGHVLADQHGIAIREKSVLFPNRGLIGLKYPLPPGQGADQHQQGGFR